MLAPLPSPADRARAALGHPPDPASDAHCLAVGAVAVAIRTDRADIAARLRQARRRADEGITAGALDAVLAELEGAW